MTLTVGLGASERDFALFGEDFEAKARAQKLNEALEIIVRAWTGEPFSYEGAHYRLHDVEGLPRPVQSPRIPIWVAGGWPLRAPLRRAARWDGLLLKPVNVTTGEVLTPDELREAIAYTRTQRTRDESFEILMSEETPGDLEASAAIVERYAGAGATWWIEHAYGRATMREYRERIRQGPPRG